MTVLAFSGKGGTGKTTLSSLAVRYFVERGQLPLALDLDPDAHLSKSLGVEVNKTVGQVIDEVQREKAGFEPEPEKPPQVADIDYFYNRIITDVLVEHDDMDLVTLGKPSSGIDCYCPAFYWTDHTVDKIVQGYGDVYDAVVLDLDPGTEIFPRKILETIYHECGIDAVFTVLDSSTMSLDTSEEIGLALEREGLDVPRRGVFNRVEGENVMRRLRQEAESRGIDVAGFVPHDDGIVERGLERRDIMDLDSAAYAALEEILEGLEGT